MLTPSLIKPKYPETNMRNLNYADRICLELFNNQGPRHALRTPARQRRINKLSRYWHRSIFGKDYGPAH